MDKNRKVRDGKVISISRDERTRILTISSNAPDPQLAFDFNTFTLDFVSDYICNSLQTQEREKKLFVEERIGEVKKDLAHSENALARFRERNILSRSPQVELEEGRLRRQVMLNQEVYLQLQKQYEMARIE